MNTPEKEIRTLFAWSELDEENRAVLAFTLNVDSDGGATFESAVNGRVMTLYHGLKALVEDNPAILDVLKAIVYKMSDESKKEE